MMTEVTAAIPAVWPAVAMCPVVQKEIAKISAVPISRHVTAFASVLRIGMLSSVSPCPSPAGASPAARTPVWGVIALNIEVPVVVIAEFRRGPWSCARSAGPLVKRVHTPLNC
jgi:hypothetical protein